jgi:hypothetical protein
VLPSFFPKRENFDFSTQQFQTKAARNAKAPRTATTKIIIFEST